MGFSAFKLVATGADGKSIRNTHNQDNHPFKAGQVVRYIIGDGGGWTAASASDSIQAEATGIIEEVVSGSEFVVVYQGEINTANFANGYGVTGGGSDDDVWFLSAGASAGRLENVAPTEGGNVIKPMLIKQSGTVGLVTGYIGTVIGGKNTVSMDQLNPVGTILPYAGVATDIPTQWALCDGRPLLVSEFGDYYNRVAHRYGFYQTLSFDSGDTSIVDLTDYLTTGTIVFEQALSEGEGTVKGNVLSWDNDTKKASVDIEYLDANDVPNGKSFGNDVQVTVTYTPTVAGDVIQWTFGAVTNATVTHVKTPDLQGRIPMGAGNYNPTNSDYVLGQRGGLDELVLTEVNVNTTDVEVGTGAGGGDTAVFFDRPRNPLTGADDVTAHGGANIKNVVKEINFFGTPADGDGPGVPENATAAIISFFGAGADGGTDIFYANTPASVWDGFNHPDRIHLSSSVHGLGDWFGGQAIVPINSTGIGSIVSQCTDSGGDGVASGSTYMRIAGYFVGDLDSGETVTISEADGGSEAFSNIQPFLASNYIIRTKAEAAVSIIDKIDIPDNGLSDHNTPTPQRGDILAYYHDGVAGSSGEYRNFKLFDGITADGTDEDFVRIDMANKKVGIGTTTPGATLDVKGDIWVTDPRGSTVPIKLYGENDVDNHPDIEFHSRALLTAGNSITLGMDKDDASDAKWFSVQKDSNVLQSENVNEILYLEEDGRLGIGSDGSGIRPSDTQQFLVKTDGTIKKHVTLTNTSETNGKSSTLTQDATCLTIETDGEGILIPNNTVIGPGGACPAGDATCALHVEGDLCVNGSISSDGDTNVGVKASGWYTSVNNVAEENVILGGSDSNVLSVVRGTRVSGVTPFTITFKNQLLNIGADNYSPQTWPSNDQTYSNNPNNPSSNGTSSMVKRYNNSVVLYIKTTPPQSPMIEVYRFYWSIIA